jgi:hypothetical protein
MSRASRLIRPALAAALLASAPGALAQQTGVGPTDTPRHPDAPVPIPDVRVLLATVNGTPIYADEIEPIDAAKQARPEDPGSTGFETWLNATRRNNLQHRIMALLQARAAEEAGLVPTEAEILAVREFRARQQQARLAELVAMRDGMEREVNVTRAGGAEPPDEVLLELRRLRNEVALMEKVLAGRQPRSRDAQVALEAAERQFASDAVRSWKFTKYLHEKYGGKVLPMGPFVEPVEAYLLLFAEEQEAGRLAFETDWARNSVIGAFESTRPQLVEPLPDAFAVPWWLSDLTPATN